MPSEEATSLALGASVYPAALAAVIALGRGTKVQLRVVLFVISAYVTVPCTGALTPFLVGDLKASRASTPAFAPDAASVLPGALALTPSLGGQRWPTERSALATGCLTQRWQPLTTASWRKSVPGEEVISQKGSRRLGA